jgi:hypothetical protein
VNALRASLLRAAGLLLAGSLCVPLCRAQADPAEPASPAPAAQGGVKNPFQPLDSAALQARMKALGATDEQWKAYGQQVAEVGATRAEDDLLRKLNPAFDAAVKKAEASDPTAALDLAKLVADKDHLDPVLGAHVRYHMARVFLDSDDPDRAVDILNEYLKENINHTALDPEVAFFYAQALSEVPLPEYAVPHFRTFLAWFPDASERFRSAAQQRIAELTRQQDSQLHQLADGMKKVERDLRRQKTDKPVQVEQEQFVEKLQKLIEEYEERQKKGGAPSGNGPSSNPATQSGLPEGNGAVGNLQKRLGVADRWGEMRDKDRKEVETAVQNNLPPEYRKMLEEYYKRLGTGAAGR